MKLGRTKYIVNPNFSTSQLRPPNEVDQIDECKTLTPKHPMQIFVSEYLTSGLCDNEQLSATLLHEGTAMLQAVLEDVNRIPDCKTITTLDHRIANNLTIAGEYHLAHSPLQAETDFHKLVNQADAVFVIAPETNGILKQQKQIVDATKEKWLGCSTSAIELCADKLALANHLQTNNIPTIPTSSLNWETNDLTNEFPIVIKPRDGAGSENMFLIKNHSDWLHTKKLINHTNQATSFIWQPYIAGTVVSIAMLANESQLFPLALQQISDDGRFQYQGGVIPFLSAQSEAISSLVNNASATIEGLNGYVGFDIILPANKSDQPIIVEINPRLTTSYIGYQALTDENLMEHILFPERFSNQICWNKNRIHFDSNGNRQIERINHQVEL